MSAKMISIKKDFSENPSGRYRTDGPWSGEAFREDVLKSAIGSNEFVTVDLDSELGFGSSFLEEAFGGLIRAGVTFEEIKKKLKITSTVAPIYAERAWRYIDEAALRVKSKNSLFSFSKA